MSAHNDHSPDAILAPLNEIPQDFKVLVADSLLAWNHLIFTLNHIRSVLKGGTGAFDWRKRLTDDDLCKKVANLIKAERARLGVQELQIGLLLVEKTKTLNALWRNKLAHSFPFNVEGEWLHVVLDNDSKDFRCAPIDSPAFQSVLTDAINLHSEWENWINPIGRKWYAEQSKGTP